MIVELSPNGEAMVRELLASGKYRDADEVVNEALRLWEELNPEDGDEGEDRTGPRSAGPHAG